MNKHIINGQPSAPKSPSTPEGVKTRQGVWEVENLEHYVPTELQSLWELYEKLVDEFGDDAYATIILSLAQRLCGIDDQITEIAIKGVDLHGEKFKIIIRER